MRIESGLQAGHSDYMRIVASFADEESAKRTHEQLVKHMEELFARADNFTCVGFGQTFESEDAFLKWKAEKWDPVANQHSTLEVTKKEDGSIQVLVQAERDMPVLRTELEALQKNAQNTDDGGVEKQAADLCALVASEQYEEIKPQPDGGLTAHTSAITIWHDDWEFSLGCYDIKIDCHGKVTIRSADGTDAQGYPHPHIDSSGKPCLGNIAPDLARAIGRMRIAEALSLLHEFLTSYNPDNPYIKLSRFDPDYSGDEDENPCEDCEERCTPYCIMDCPHNEGSAYSCSDCCDYRTDFCYGECERNRDYDYVHPCHNCEEEKDHCFLECPWNKEWQLSNPCEECESDECDDECGYFAKREELSFQKGGPNAGREQPQQVPTTS